MSGLESRQSPVSTGVVAMPKSASRLLAVPALLAGVLAGPALAGQFDFVPAPQTDLNRIYRIDRVTGEVGACQYGQKEGTFGVTLCFPAGDGAGKQEPSEYGLVSSRHEREGGVFRVDMRTGAMSVCYVFDERVVCTPPEKGAIVAAAPAAPAGPVAAPAAPEITGTIRKPTP
jgi:hypothetical protein